MSLSFHLLKPITAQFELGSESFPMILSEDVSNYIEASNHHRSYSNPLIIISQADATNH